MDLIVISNPEKVAGEASIINDLFTEGLECLHLRKPGYSEEQLAALILSIAPEWRGRISLHQHHGLAERLGIRRLHFTEANLDTVPPQHLAALHDSGFVLSTSIHHPDRLRTLPGWFHYVFLSPVFDSVSKRGYQAALPVDFKLDRSGFPGKVIALGGIEYGNLARVPDMGFDGAAVLGTIWQNPAAASAQLRHLRSAPPPNPGFQPWGSTADQAGSRTADQTEHLHPAAAYTHLRSARARNPGFQPWGRAADQAGSSTAAQTGHPHSADLPQQDLRVIDRLHFISNETESMSHIDSIHLALGAGCRWIQLRVKNRPEEEVLSLAWEATRLCDSYAAKLVINDFPRVARAVEAYGLHLGLTDMPIPDARALVGSDMVIGGTANTWEDIALRMNEGADYVGLGPFRFTTTKQNLSPVLGATGYDSLIARMAHAARSVPIIAIGGILPEDIPALRAAGVHGVAMSSAVINADDPKKTVYQIHQALC
nr:thiamine phosphate synthase [uncultured Dyadobacter sp.]